MLKLMTLFCLGFLALFFVGVGEVWAQSFTLSGTVRDGKTRESLVGATVGVRELRGRGAACDVDGRYTIRLERGEYTLRVECIGYEPKDVKVSLQEDLQLDIVLQERAYALQEVVVSARRADANVSSAQVGVELIEVKEINLLPVIFGERDIIKALQLTPGVKSAGETSSGFFVRGGSSDQNLILLDNVSLYNASHLMGFFSTFNSDVLSNVTLFKGAMPAQYGERLAAILDVQHRNGDTQDYHLNGGLGLISSRLSVEGPIQKGKSSFLIGARRTYADAVGRLTGIEEMKDNYLYFYDLNMKLHFALSDRDQLSVSGFYGRDRMLLTDLAEMNWGNLFGSVRWHHTFNPRWSSSTTFFYNKYDYYMGMDIGMELDASADIQDLGLKQEFLFLPRENNEWRFGLHATHHNMAPGDMKMVSDDEFHLNLHHRYSLENALYATNQLKLSDRFELVYGLRLSAYMALGNGEYYTLDDRHNVVDTMWYNSGKVVKTYLNLEPRISGAFRLNEVSSLKAAYARTTQNMHLLSYTAQGTPFDRWISSSNNVRPQIADQVSLGYFRNFSDNTYEISVEGYYKGMQNQIDFKDHADLQTRNAIETELLFGKGRAYGLEMMLRKRTGVLTGWISYTLAKSEKKIDGINNNRWYNAYQDRTHDVSIVGIYELNPKWTLSAAWVYYTGNAISYPSGKYQINGNDVMYYAERNGYRMPAYHRLDLGATCKLKKIGRMESELAFSLYNAYGRENAYMIRFRTDHDDDTRTTAYQYSLFRFVPSISWNFRF